MDNVQQRKVGEIAAENPSSVRVFESLGIDYCCGGKKSLSDACSGADVPVDRVLELLAKAESDSQGEQTESWAEEPLANLIAHIIEEHHEFVRREIPRIESLLKKVVARHGQIYLEIPQIEQLFEAVGREMSTHMLKEEQVLFPYIERMEAASLRRKPMPPAFFGSVTRPIAHMMADHDNAGALVARIHVLSSGYALPEGACATFRALYEALADFERDLHRHVHLENNVLFPRAATIEQQAEQEHDSNPVGA